MKAYLTKIAPVTGTSFAEVSKKVRALFRSIEKRTRRRAYLRSAYFEKEKIFLEYFWPHLNQKPARDRLKRLKYFPCAVDLIEHSRFRPISKTNPNNSQEKLHRFAGITQDQTVFYVQIKENCKTGQKFLMSVFPPD